MSPTVSIDRDDCISCGNCESVCPEFFEESAQDGMTEVVPDRRKGADIAAGEAPEELRPCVTAAAEQCPVGIIHVE